MEFCPVNFKLMHLPCATRGVGSPRQNAGSEEEAPPRSSVARNRGMSGYTISLEMSVKSEVKPSSMMLNTACLRR